MPRRRLLEPLFIDGNKDPVQFYLHESVDEGDRIELTDLIQKYGGIVIDTNEGANTVVVDRDYDVFDLQNAYYTHPERQFRRIRVEDTTFVRACIKRRTFQHTPVARYPMRGNHSGRVNYTKEDEEHFCRYMAIKIPDNRSGGRLGHRVYEDMVKLAQVMPIEYRWVNRHSAQSWREHYRSKKNRARLDAVIERFSREEQPTEEQSYIYDRKLTGKGPKIVGRYPSIDREPQSYDKYRKRQGGRSHEALMEEEEESSPNEETSGDEEDTPDKSERDRPSSLFSVDQYQEEQMEEQVDKAQPANYTFNEPLASQATLVGQGNRDPTVGQSPIRARQHSDQETTPTEGAIMNEPEESQEHIGSMNIAEPQLPIPPVMPITYQGKRKRGQKAQVPTHDAPYRNTRTRSGSVGPPPATDLAIPRRVARGRKKKAIEATQNEESANQGRAGPALVPETITEEADVEQLLMMETNGEGSRTPNSHPQQQRSWSAIRILQTMGMVEEAEGQSHRHPSSPNSSQRRVNINDVSEEAKGQGRTDLNTPSGRSPRELQWSAMRILQSLPRDGKVEEVEEKPLHRRRTLETDDEQIDRKLRQTKPDYDDLDPAEILREFNASKSHFSPTSVSSPSSRAQRPSLAPSSERDADEDPGREVSVESFPKHGTRAREIKEQGEEKRKREEYVPSLSTRAGLYVQQRR